MIKEVSIENISEKGIEINNRCFTGEDGNQLIDPLKEAFKRACRIDIIVAFIMESGVRILEDTLKEIIERYGDQEGNQDKKIRILTGNYLGITQPSALYLLKAINGDKADMRFYSEKNRSFHPKAYIVHYEDGDGDIFIGSSNISKSALTYGVEWNYRIRKRNNEEDFKTYCDEFERLFYNKSIILNDEELKRYSDSWVRPKVTNTLEKYDEEDNSNVVEMYQPKGAQIEALDMLEKSREEGLDKALVVAATGIGKTFLAAFDCEKFKRILFVVHKVDILKQAENTFKLVYPDKETCIFNGDSKEVKGDMVFASVQTLGKKEYLNDEYFSKEHFDYVVIDEFHHAVANNYKNIIEYFKPKFMLGLTATPDRLDNKDVYALCDYNVVYEVGLREAINKGWLCPFRYYGIYDSSTDYSNIDMVKGKYVEKQLEKELIKIERANLILKHYRKFNSKRALGFCSTKIHAESMAKFFNDNGIKSYAVYSGARGEFSCDRESALRALEQGEVDIIFSVDMFNEGIDVKAIDMVMFLRPTESPTVFLQQLGRGLRLHKDKQYLNVLDFIGNYKKANLIPHLLKGKKFEDTGNTRGLKKVIPTEEELPEECQIDFDIELIDMFREMDEKQKKIGDKILEEFYRIKEDLEHIPSRVEIFTYMDDDIYENMKKKKALNLFKGYLGFLNKNNELMKDEIALTGTIAEDFINMIEETSMSKTYKMPVLLAFYNNGNVKMKINDDDLYESFKEFYSKGSNACDLTRDESTKNYKSWGKKEYVSLAKKNPVKFLLKSSSQFFYMDNGEMCLNDELKKFIDNVEFKKHFVDAVNFRAVEFYKGRLEKRYEK